MLFKFSCRLIMSDGGLRSFVKTLDCKHDNLEQAKADFVAMAQKVVGVERVEDVANATTPDVVKDGYWNRNKARQYKPINAANPLELNVGNGRWGQKTGRQFVYVQKFGPQDGKMRRFKKKKGCKLVSALGVSQSQFRIRDKILAARGSVLSLQTMGVRLSPEMTRFLGIAENWIRGNCNAQEQDNILKKDIQRERCTLGRLAQGQKGNYANYAKIREIQSKVGFFMKELM